MSFTTKSIEALDAPAGPFHRLVDLAATLFDCRAAVVTLLTPTEAIIRSNAGLCAARTPRENSLTPLVVEMGRGAVLVITLRVPGSGTVAIHAGVTVSPRASAAMPAES